MASPIFPLALNPSIGGPRPDYEIPEQQLPASLTAVTLKDVRVWELHIVNDGGGSAFVRIASGLGAVLWSDKVALPQGGVISVRSAARKMTGGFYWSASIPGVWGWGTLVAA